MLPLRLMMRNFHFPLICISSCDFFTKEEKKTKEKNIYIYSCLLFVDVSPQLLWEGVKTIRNRKSGEREGEAGRKQWSGAVRTLPLLHSPSVTTFLPGFLTCACP